MNDIQKMEGLNQVKPAFMQLLGGEVVGLDSDAGTCTFEFNIGTDLCHSVNVIQGGFVTAMLDASMAHAGFGLIEGVQNIATLEIKVSFYEASLAGQYKAIGKLDRIGGSVGFMSAELYNDAGTLTATATSTAKLIRPR